MNSARRSLPAVISMLLISPSFVALALVLGAQQAPDLQTLRTAPRTAPGLRPPASGFAGPGSVVAETKIGNEEDGFPDTLDAGDGFGTDVVVLGDVDGDGVQDLAASFQEHEGFAQPGGVFVLFLTPDGGVRAHQKIGAHDGGLEGELSSDLFGAGLCPLGDLDGDGVPDLAACAPNGGDASGAAVGVIWLLFLEPDGKVGRFVKLFDFDCASVANVGDLDGDGTPELAVGTPTDLDGAPSSRGAVTILFLAPDGTIRTRQRINETEGGFTGVLQNGENFGRSVAPLGDFDGDGVRDLAVGSTGGVGAIWILFLDTDGTVKSHQKLDGLGGGFGTDVDVLGDVDGDGNVDLAVGAPRDDDGGFDRGAVWLVYLDSDGSLAAAGKISDFQGGFAGVLDDQDQFGTSVAGLGDLDGDGRADLAVGARGDDDGGETNADGRGAVWILFGGAGGSVRDEAKISDRPGSLEGTLDDGDGFGRALAVLGDLDGDGIAELAVGAPGDDDGARSAGAVWTFSFDATGGVRSYAKIGALHGGFTGLLETGDEFGSALAPLGDLDGDGVGELAVGAASDDDGGANSGAVWILFLHADGTVRTQQKISRTEGGFTDSLFRDDFFGSSLASIGDLDGDGTGDLVVGAPGDNNGGAFWVLTLAPDGTVRSARETSRASGGFSGGDEFLGVSLASLGDLDGDGIVDLAIGGGMTSLFASPRGKAWIAFLDASGGVRSSLELTGPLSGFQGTLDDGDAFGQGLAALGDLDGNGVTELAVGASRDDDGGPGQFANLGAIWILFLERDGRVATHQKISATRGSFGGSLSTSAEFGRSVAALGDFDGDGIADLAAGAHQDSDGGDGHGSLWLLSLDGIARVGFEERDDQARTPLVNGQALVPGTFARALELSSSGANLGPAIFDSTPLGPNDPSQDRDLLVGKRHLLILQNSQAPTQAVTGVFDRPNDDEDGGLVVFRFPAPVAPLSLDLVDIDLGASQSASVHLFDAASRTRVFSIPAGWTEDLLTHGPPAWRTLDLTRLDPQAGFVSASSAGEDVGFDAHAVVRVEVTLGSSGALDDLTWDPHPDR